MSVVDEILVRVSERRDRSNGSATQAIQVDDGKVRAHVRLRDADRFTCLLDRVEVARLVPSPHEGTTVDRVTAQAAFLTTRLTYLLEHLTVTELDQTHGLAQLRSTTPDTRDGVRCFYEVTLERGAALSLVRYRHEPVSGVKSSIPLVMTTEVLVRVLDDLTAALWV